MGAGPGACDTVVQVRDDPFQRNRQVGAAAFLGLGWPQGLDDCYR